MKCSSITDCEMLVKCLEDLNNLFVCFLFLDFAFMGCVPELKWLIDWLNNCFNANFQISIDDETIIYKSKFLLK